MTEEEFEQIEMEELLAKDATLDELSDMLSEPIRLSEESQKRIDIIRSQESQWMQNILRFFFRIK